MSCPCFPSPVLQLRHAICFSKSSGSGSQGTNTSRCHKAGATVPLWPAAKLPSYGIAPPTMGFPAASFENTATRVRTAERIKRNKELATYANCKSRDISESSSRADEPGFAALNTLDGSVIATCMEHHRHQEWLKFLRLIDHQTPADKQLHLIVDNYATHKHPVVQRWAERHMRFHFHYTPPAAVGSAWSNDSSAI